MARIYISSTYNDLWEERRSAAEAVLSMEHFPVGMEQYSASEQRPLDKCLVDVRSCQGYLGIFAWRYGYIPRLHQKSITQLEYEEAGKHNLPRMLFLLSEEASWPASKMDREQRQIRTLREHLETEHTVNHFSNVHQLTAQVTAAVSKAFHVGRSIPDLLPYLANRDEQEFQLGKTLQKLSQPYARPVVCLIHGDEFQSHEMLLKRLKEVTLPKLFALHPEQAAIVTYALDWPARFRHIDELHEKLHKKLAERLLNRSLASAEEVNHALAGHPTPVVIHTHLLTEDWQQHGLQALNGFLQFWQCWPPLSPSQRLLVCLFIKYQVQQNFGFWKRRRFKTINSKIAKLLETFDFSPFDRLPCVVLPRLDGVTRLEVENWARSHDTIRFCQNEDIEDVLAEIRGCFQRWESQASSTAIPMERLAFELKHILYKYNAVKGGFR